jgi:hypothetical protein
MEATIRAKEAQHKEQLAVAMKQKELAHEQAVEDALAAREAEHREAMDEVLAEARDAKMKHESYWEDQKQRQEEAEAAKALQEEQDRVLAVEAQKQKQEQEQEQEEQEEQEEEKQEKRAWEEMQKQRIKEEQAGDQPKDADGTALLLAAEGHTVATEGGIEGGTEGGTKGGTEGGVEGGTEGGTKGGTEGGVEGEVGSLDSANKKEAIKKRSSFFRKNKEKSESRKTHKLADKEDEARRKQQMMLATQSRLKSKSKKMIRMRSALNVAPTCDLSHSHDHVPAVIHDMRPPPDWDVAVDGEWDYKNGRPKEKAVSTKAKNQAAARKRFAAVKIDYTREGPPAKVVNSYGWDMVLKLPCTLQPREVKNQQKYTLETFQRQMMGLLKTSSGRELIERNRAIFKTPRCLLTSDIAANEKLEALFGKEANEWSLHEHDEVEEAKYITYFKQVLEEEYREHNAGGTAPCTARKYHELCAKSVVMRLQVACGLETDAYYSFDRDEIIITVKADENDLRIEAARTGYELHVRNEPFSEKNSMEDSRWKQMHKRAYFKSKRHLQEVGAPPPLHPSTPPPLHPSTLSPAMTPFSSSCSSDMRFP